MVRLALQVAYDGTPYRGWTDVRDCVLRPTLGRILHGDASAMPMIEAASRTDAGVHSRGGQVCSTTLESARAVCEADIGQLVYSLNQCLPPEVAISRAALVTDAFDVRATVGKTYMYQLSTRPGCRDPLTRLYEWHVPSQRGRPPWDATRVSELAAQLQGTHRFTAFGNRPRGGERHSKVNPVCTLRELSLQSNEATAGMGLDAESWTIIVRGDRFLYKMVRNLVGALVKVGSGDLASEEVLEALEQGAFSRSASVPLTAPACGLALAHVEYAAHHDPFGLDGSRVVADG